MNLNITDPEFIERFQHFALEEVLNEKGRQLPENIRYMAVLAASSAYT